MKRELLYGDRVSAIGLIRYARAFYASYDHLSRTRLPNSTFYPVNYYLACHSMELSMKAVLRHHKTTLDVLMNEYGHDLYKLQQALISQQFLTFSEVEGRAISEANHLYSTKQFEYIQRGVKSFPDELELGSSALTILQKAVFHVSGRTPLS